MPRSHQLPGPGPSCSLVQRTSTTHPKSGYQSRDDCNGQICAPQGFDVLMRVEPKMCPYTSLHEVRSGLLRPPLHGPTSALSFEDHTLIPRYVAAIVPSLITCTCIYYAPLSPDFEKEGFLVRNHWLCLYCDDVEEIPFRFHDATFCMCQGIYPLGATCTRVWNGIWY